MDCAAGNSTDRLGFGAGEFGRWTALTLVLYVGNNQMDTLPLFLGGLFFLFCSGAAFVYSVFIGKGKARWGGLPIFTVGLLGLVPLAMVAEPIHPTLASLSGTYRGNFGDGINTIILHSNGTFDQNFVQNNGKVCTNRGTWKIADSDLGGGIDFDHLLMPVDISGKAQAPQVISFSNAAIHGIEHAIYFNEDDDIRISRIQE